MAFEGIVVKGARENNLKNIDVKVPRNKLTVVTGLSGSGKSTLAFDIIYAEGQRRYVESLSAYARNFMHQMKKPDLDLLTGLSPSIAIDQKTVLTNPRSTVGTVTEIYDYLRLLYARVGQPVCPIHKTPVSSQKPQTILEEVLSHKKNEKFYVLAPVVQDQKGEFLAHFRKWQQKGYVKALVDGQWIELDKAKKLEKHKRHTIYLLIDRLKVDSKFKDRLAESLNQSFMLANGTVVIQFEKKLPKLYSIHSACGECGFSFPDLDPRHFSFNNPRGACKECDGLGSIEYEIEEDKEVYYEFEDCETCEGTRLSELPRNVLIDGKTITELSKLSVDVLIKTLSKIKLEKKYQIVAEKILEQIKNRLQYMQRVGTSYLSLDRQTRTLSGGEVQRIRLATQVGSSLVGVLYVLDEPSIGLHPRDHDRLLDILKEIRDKGNTVILVEHDADTMNAADHIIDLGPGAGSLGGTKVAEGTLAQVKKSKKSITGQYLSKKIKVEVPAVRRKGRKEFIEILGATGNNLKSVDLKIPLGLLCGVTGVSGSGKSTLIIDTLYKALMKEFYKSKRSVSPFKELKGTEHLERIIQINQKPIGRTPRSTPATYVGLFPAIRDLYASLPESKIRGYKAGHFSFNVKGGRCEECTGYGLKKVEMNFMADVYVECDTCMGLRYTGQTRSLKFKDKSIADVLKMTVDEAAEFFKNHKRVYAKLLTLQKVGLGYLTLGQSSTTLSGGEAQRVKLSKELSKRSDGKALYILDEPTTGLHFADVKKLVQLLHELTDQGNTVLVIEHNLDVVKNCDYLIDMGPEGGDAGGVIVAQGSPEKLAKSTKSITGKYLKPYLS